ncbi:MAG: molybdopterin-dependent oxidoreductase [Acidimicrobiales bacterium]|nr:molybdopterin-dependent oxidoreductase [Acidimicrobiales bacterium]
MATAFTHWGTYELTVSDGRIDAVRGVAADPDPSPIAQNLLDVADHPLRIRRPAVRRGFLEEVDTGRRSLEEAPARRRGGEPFVELSWADAAALAAAELDRVRVEHGNAAIFAGSYGWASAGRFHYAQGQLYRFLNLLGGFTISRDSYSYAAAQVIVPHIVAPWFDVLGNHTSYEVLARHGRLVLALGGLPAKNQQVENGGTYRHQGAAGLRLLREAGVRIISVSPLHGDVADELGASWLPIRPGTDTALLLGIAHTLVTEGLHDEAFLERCCSGVERFLASLAGRDATWAAAICGLDAETIRDLARDLAAGPSMVTASWSLQRAEHGEQAYWATVAVAALLGQIGTPGGGFGLGYGSVNRVGSAEHGFSLPRLPTGPNPVDSFIPVARITELLDNPGGSFTYDGCTYTYPDTRLVYWCGGNPFHHHQDLGSLVAAWQRPETVIVHEQVWNPLARHADIVLPISHTLERDDFGSSPLTGTIVAMPKVLDPPGEARSDHAAFAAIAAELGLLDAFTEGLDEAGWLRRLWTETRKRAAAQGADLPGFEEFWAMGVTELPRPARPRVLLEAFRADPEANPLRTPSGRIELYSPVIDAFGLADCPPTPTWLEPLEWAGSSVAERFPLHLLSNQPVAKLHSQLDFGRASVATKRSGREVLRMHPADAAARGLDDGDIARVFNDRGACLASVGLTDDLRRGVVVLPTGSWYDPLVGGDPSSMCVHGNPNVLTSGRPASALSQAPAAQSCLVEVERFVGEVPPVRAHTPPSFVADPRPR